MERILLGVLFLSGWSMCLKRPLRQYHYVPKTMTWTEAQTYCRQNYADLATIENTEEMDQMNRVISSAGSNSEVWIGLNTFINWQWSDGYTGSGAEYRHWDNNQPDFNNGNEHCVVSYNGSWHDYPCTDIFPFICNNGTQGDTEFVVMEKKNWSSARTYCRENFFDLATVRYQNENQKIQSLMQDAKQNTAWIGLFRPPNTSWSDGSGSSFTNWKTTQNPFRLNGKWCVASSGTWRLKPCDARLPFVCHGEPSPPVSIMRQLLKLRLKVDDSSVDLNDPAVKASILKQLQDKLKEGGLDGISLQWREQPDGKVFHKEEKGFEKKATKNKPFERKTEL